MTDTVLPLPAWVGTLELDEGASGFPDDLPERFRGARLLLTRGGRPLRVVDLAVTAGQVDRATLGAHLPVEDRADEESHGGRGDVAPGSPPTGRSLPSTWVAVPTHDRPEHLAMLLDHLAALPDPDVALLVVDNGPSDDRTRDLVLARARADPRLRYVRERVAGTSRARNRALAEAHEHGVDVVAFVDDDVTMRPGWLAAVRGAVADAAVAGAPVSCVTGPVLAGTLETVSQLASDGALGWTAGFTARRFALDDPSAAALFPFAPGEYGVGANFAVVVADALAVGGFDELLGGGSPTRGGEDIEFWVRLVTSGRVLAYEPAAWLWHHHRDSERALHAQLAGYARGLGGYLGAVACHRRMRALALRRLPRAVAHVEGVRRRERAVGVGVSAGGFAPAAVLRGLATYLWCRLVRRCRRTGW